MANGKNAINAGKSNYNIVYSFPKIMVAKMDFIVFVKHAAQGKVVEYVSCRHKYTLNRRHQ